MEGWISLHRKLLKNDLWKCEKFTRGQAWVDLLLLANYSDSFFYKRGIKIDVKRGQVGRSELELSDRWGWSRTKIRKFLNDLEKEQQIIQHKSKVTQLLTIVNYEEYQEKEQQTRQQKDNKKTTKRQQKDTYNKDNKNKQEQIKKINYTEFSENFYKYQSIQFPNRVDDSKKSIDNGADIIDKLIRLDGFTFDEIQKALRFAVKDDFWKSQLYSLSGLRKRGKNGSTKFVNLLAAYDKSDHIEDIAEYNKKQGEEYLRDQGLL